MVIFQVLVKEAARDKEESNPDKAEELKDCALDLTEQQPEEHIKEMFESEKKDKKKKNGEEGSETRGVMKAGESKGKTAGGSPSDKPPINLK